MADRRKTSKHSRECLPVGAIVVRRVKRRKMRYIKVRNSGPKQKRWRLYARWWWENNRGSVPDGKRVIHLDGDSMNDDPSNLDLGTPSDVAFLWHDRDPEGSERSYQLCGTATAASNRERAAIRRETSWLPSRWYPVEVATGAVVNSPVRRRWQVYGDDFRPRTSNAAFMDSRAMGWPEEQFEWACILSVLAEAGTPIDLRTLIERVANLRRQYGWKALLTPARRAHAVLSDLSRRGWVLQFKMQKHHSGKKYAISSSALTARGPVSPFVPSRGRVLALAPRCHLLSARSSVASNSRASASI